MRDSAIGELVEVTQGEDLSIPGAELAEGAPEGVRRFGLLERVGGRRTVGTVTFRNPAVYDSLTSAQVDIFRSRTDFLTYLSKRAGANLTAGRGFSELVSRDGWGCGDGFLSAAGADIEPGSANGVDVGRLGVGKARKNILSLEVRSLRGHCL